MEQISWCRAATIGIVLNCSGVSVVSRDPHLRTRRLLGLVAREHVHRMASERQVSVILIAGVDFSIL